MVDRLIEEADTAIVGPKIVAWDDPTRLEEVGMAADRSDTRTRVLRKERSTRAARPRV